MRRGSISTHADDARRHSAGIVPSPEQRNNNRQEFSVNDMSYERMGGCFISYRKIAFFFVFVLAMLIAAAFIAVHLTTPPDVPIQDTLAILAEEDVVPEKYIIASSIKPLLYHIELTPSVHKGAVKIEGHVVIDFIQNGTNGPDQLVFDSNHLNIKKYRLIFYDKENSTKDEKGKRHKRNEEEAKDALVTEQSSDNSTNDINNAGEPNFKTELKITGNKTDVDGSDYVIFLENPMKNGTYTLEIDYETIVHSKAIFMKNFTKDNEEKLLLVTKLKPVNAPRLFPTLDEAKLKANFVLTILHSNNTKVLSNMPLMNSSEVSDSMISDTFAETRKLFPHNLAFVSASSDIIEEIKTLEINNSQPVTYWSNGYYKSHDFYLNEKITSVFEVYDDMFGDIERPSDKLDLLALPVDFDGLSAPGLIVIRDSLFYTANTLPLLTRAKALLNLIGLVGEQWLGSLVNAKNWTDAWYLEGSVIYLQYALVDKIDRSLEASHNFLVDVQLDTMENDGYLIAKSLDSKVNRTRIEALDLPDNYRKGACLISMLHATLNEKAFKTGYANFLRRWSYKNADANDFLHDVAADAIIDSESKVKLHKAFSSWIHQPGYPLINVTWHRENSTIMIRQGKFFFDEIKIDDEDEETETLANNDNKELWWVPLTYVNEQSNWSEPTIVWLKGNAEMALENVAHSADNNSWIIFNVNRTGYYRVNYDEATWHSIILALKNRHDDFPITTRASLVDDALSLARQGSLSHKIALELLSYYLGPNERDYAPWKALARHALHLDFALYETAAYPNFQEFMQKLVSKLYEDMETKINEGSPLVTLAIELACKYQYKRCTKWAKEQWADIYQNNQNSLFQHVRETVYCIGAQRGGQDELSYFMKEFIKESNDTDEKARLLSALGCFQTPWILQKILTEILETNKYQDNDIKVILLSYAKNPAAAQVARRFIQENWKTIVKRFSNSYWTMKAFVEASTSLLFTERDLNEFNSFRDQHVESLKMMGHWVALNEMKAYSWISRLKDSSNSIQRWFKNYMIAVV